MLAQIQLFITQFLPKTHPAKAGAPRARQAHWGGTEMLFTDTLTFWTIFDVCQDLLSPYPELNTRTPTPSLLPVP